MTGENDASGDGVPEFVTDHPHVNLRDFHTEAYKALPEEEKERRKRHVALIARRQLEREGRRGPFEKPAETVRERSGRELEKFSSSPDTVQEQVVERLRSDGEFADEIASSIRRIVKGRTVPDHVRLRAIRDFFDAEGRVEEARRRDGEFGRSGSREERIERLIDGLVRLKELGLLEQVFERVLTAEKENGREIIDAEAIEVIP